MRFGHKKARFPPKPHQISPPAGAKHPRGRRGTPPPPTPPETARPNQRKTPPPAHARIYSIRYKHKPTSHTPQRWRSDASARRVAWERSAECGVSPPACPGVIKTPGDIVEYLSALSVHTHPIRGLQTPGYSCGAASPLIPRTSPALHRDTPCPHAPHRRQTCSTEDTPPARGRRNPQGTRHTEDAPPARGKSGGATPQE